MTSPAPAPEKPATDDGDDNLTHLYCSCSPLLGLCGVDLADASYNPNPAPEDECIVCGDLDEHGCTRCGE